MKIWIKLTRDVATHKAGEVREEEEDVARAYINAGVAVEEKQAEEDILSIARSELAKAREDLQKAALENIQEQTRAMGALKDAMRPRPQAPPPDNQSLVATESEDDKMLRAGGGFKSLGHFAHSVYRGMHPSNPQNESAQLLRSYNDLMNRVVGEANKAARALGSPDGMFENADPDGGALVPPTFSNKIWERVYEQAELLKLLDGYNVTGNTFRLPKNAETSRVDGSRWGGTLGYWEGEAQQFTGSRPKFDWVDLRLKKLTVLTFVTNELLTDAGIALDQYLQKKASDEITFKINDALINGTGAGIPQGILNNPALISVAKDTGQATKTISYTNILGMWNSMWAPLRSRAIWVYNQECEPQFDQMVLPVGTGGVPVFVSDGGPGAIFGAAKQGQQMTLKGRPMIPLEQCPGLGLQGDLMFIAWDQVVCIMKGGVQSSMSIHLKFDFDESVFKWLFRMDAQGAWTKPLTPYKTNTSKTYGSCVALAAR